MTRVTLLGGSRHRTGAQVTATSMPEPVHVSS